MQPEQYAIMEQVEDRHWWYLGLRDLLMRYWQQPELRLPSHLAVLDAGCGTGGNLRFFHDCLGPEYLAGFDQSDVAIDSAKRKCATADLYLSDICQPFVRPSGFDLIFCCDVIYVPGLEAARPGLLELARALRPGGQFILHVPAYNWLKSHHDRAVHTRERFVLSQIGRLMVELDLECLRASYRLSSLLPLVVARRLPELIRLSHNTSSRDLEMPPAWLNRWLLRLVQHENRYLARGGKLPFGSSIIAVGRKHNLEC